MTRRRLKVPHVPLPELEILAASHGMDVWDFLRQNAFVNDLSYIADASNIDPVEFWQQCSEHWADAP